jgi:hypothetical protein
MFPALLYYIIFFIAIQLEILKNVPCGLFFGSSFFFFLAVQGFEVHCLIYKP